jgi:hypothetical protein
MSTDKNKPDPASAPELESKQTMAQFGKVDYGTSQGLRFYANHVAANATLFDVRLILSDVDVQGDGVKAIQTLAVLMSYELAQLLHMTLGRTLENYAEAYGKSRLPEVAIGGIKSDIKQPAKPE